MIFLMVKRHDYTVCALNKSQSCVKYGMEGRPNVQMFVAELVDMLY